MEVVVFDDVSDFLSLLGVEKAMIVSFEEVDRVCLGVSVGEPAATGVATPGDSLEQCEKP